MRPPTPSAKVWLALITLALLGASGATWPVGEVELPFSRYVLSNGLTLVVHEDHSAPLVAVNVSYHAGSKDDVPGRRGVAHLVEHLMFNGSEHFQGDYFGQLESVGATDLNGLTDVDRTRYFQTVPTSALDVVLWMESDRMASLLGALDQAKLEEQLAVVRNERREAANQPYGRVFETIFQHAYPPEHPYAHPVTGRDDDLDALTVDDVEEWIGAHYGAANAVVTVAGDVEAEEVRALVESYFGHVPSGPPNVRLEQWPARRTGSRRISVQDRVPQPRVYKAWNVPGWGSSEAVHLDLVSDVLASGASSRLSRALIHRDRLSTEVEAFLIEHELGSLFVIQATPVDGVGLQELEAALDRELADLLDGGPSAEELERAATRMRSRFIRGVERIGGPGGVADVLAMNQVFAGDPDFFRSRLAQASDATAEELRVTARTWLADGELTLEVHPFGEGAVVASTIDRSAPPAPGPPPVVSFPRLHRATLSNGLPVVLAERPEVPLVDVRIVVNAGYSADASGLPGTASLALAMLEQGAAGRSALEVGNALEDLGATLRTGSDLDVSVVTISSLREKLGPSLELFADIVLRPDFAETEVDRLRDRRIAEIREERADPVWAALRVLPGLMYGAEHAYGGSLSGSGTESSVASIDGETLADFHRTWFKPNNATLVVVGATTLEEMIPELEHAFGRWEAGPVPDKRLPVVQPAEGHAVFILDRPGAPQSAIVAGHLVPPKDNPDELAIEAVNAVLGDFGGRINMNLREDKGWSYGAQSLIWRARGPRPFLIVAPVQTDKTGAAIEEIAMELEGVTGDRPVTAAELDWIVSSRRLGMAGTLETNRQVMNAITDMFEFGLADGHFDSLSSRLAELTAAGVARVARETVQSNRVYWVVVGDREAIEPELHRVGLGPVFEIDESGHVQRRLATTP